MNKQFTDLVVEAAQVLKHHNSEKFTPVIRWMLAREKQTRAPTRGGKRMIQLQGVKGKSGRFPIDAALLQPKRKP